MDSIEKLRDYLATVELTAWDHLPDLDLYMDQVLSYMPRQQLLGRPGDALTSAMINNYSKHGLVPRANGKKYNRDHLVYLTAVCLLKQVLSVADLDTLLKEVMAGQAAKDFYDAYGGLVKQEAQELADSLGQEDLGQLALRLAVGSCIQKLACEQVLDLIQGQGNKEPSKA